MANYNVGKDPDPRTCPNCLSEDTWSDDNEMLHCENCLYVEE